MIDWEKQAIPTNFNLNWDFKSYSFVAEISDYNGYNEVVDLYIDSNACNLVLPIEYLPGLKEQHYADKRIKIKVN